MPVRRSVLAPTEKACNQKRHDDLEHLAAGHRHFEFHSTRAATWFAQVANLSDIRMLSVATHNLTLLRGQLQGNVFRTLAY